MFMSDIKSTQTIHQYEEDTSLSDDKYILKKPKPIRSQTSEMKFGNTTYIITTIFNEQARDTVEQKLLQLVTERISGEIKTQIKGES